MQPRRGKVSSQLNPTFDEEIHKPKEMMKEEKKYEVAVKEGEKIVLLEEDKSLEITLNFVKLPRFLEKIEKFEVKKEKQLVDDE